MRLCCFLFSKTIINKNCLIQTDEWLQLFCHKWEKQKVLRSPWGAEHFWEILCDVTPLFYRRLGRCFHYEATLCAWIYTDQVHLISSLVFVSQLKSRRTASSSEQTNGNCFISSCRMFSSAHLRPSMISSINRCAYWRQIALRFSDIQYRVRRLISSQRTRRPSPPPSSN